ncbi:MAG: hypothetical protein ACFFBL_09565 [Promethearchaeota archaeon]
MSTRCLFLQKDLEQFEQIHGQAFELSKEQHVSLRNNAAISLTKQQLDHMLENISGNQTIPDYVTSFVNHFQPLSVSLFVFNDPMWKLMEKKSESTNTMLPIATIPRFYWKESTTTPKNPHGVKRDMSSDLVLDIEPHESITIEGLGGEFCGILEGQLVERETGPRPIISPTLPGSKKMVPKYSSQDIKIKLQFGRLKGDLYPKPSDSIDYIFSEHPKVFYEHGLSVSSDGLHIQLGVGNRKAHPLHGNVVLLFGKRWESDTPGHKIISYHVWLNALFDLLIEDI